MSYECEDGDEVEDLFNLLKAVLDAHPYIKGEIFFKSLIAIFGGLFLMNF